VHTPGDGAVVAAAAAAAGIVRGGSTFGELPWPAVAVGWGSVSVASHGH
jgi:hypothetical protein